MNRPEAEQIATAVSIIRPDWVRTSLLTTLERLPAHHRARPARDVHLALVFLAYDPATHTPGRLGQDGPWWAVAALAGPGTDMPREPGIVTYCTHGEPGLRCTLCHPRTTAGVPPTDAYRAAREALRGLGATNSPRPTPEHTPTATSPQEAQR